MLAPPLDGRTAQAFVLPAGTVIELALLQPIGSKLNKRGDRFGLRLVEDVSIDGRVILPAGIIGEGEVVHAAPSKMGGKPGELLLAARFLDHDGARIPLKAFKLGMSGKNNANLSIAVSIAAGPLALFIQGGEVVAPTGSPAHAKLAADYPPVTAAPLPVSSGQIGKDQPQ